jgi:putative spermidine/putrescine transport system permease protein
MGKAVQVETGTEPVVRSFNVAGLLVWMGVLPFFIFVVLFLLWPSSSMIIGSFQDPSGHFTFKNIVDLFTPSILNSYLISIQLSFVTAIVGTIFGFFLAYAAILGGLPRWVRITLMTLCGVASNFAGVPLAFAFIATVGRTGFLTALLNDTLGFNIYQAGFNLYNFWGLALMTYIYFQFPLMVLIIAPSLDGLRREWKEASENLGASSWQYWRYVALPILLPSLLGTMILLFGNSFGAYATAYALTGGFLNLITIIIGQQVAGNVLYNPNLGYTLALGMIVVMAVSISLYTWLQRRTARWLR